MAGPQIIRLIYLQTMPFIIIFIVFTYPYFLPPNSHVSEDTTTIYPLTFVPLHWPNNSGCIEMNTS